MFRHIVIFLMCFYPTMILIPTFALASDVSSKDKAIMQLLRVMKTTDNMEISLEGMEDTISMNSSFFIQEIEGILARDLEMKDIQRATEKYRTNDFGSERLYELFRHRFNLEQFQKEVVLPVYREYYSEEEIYQLTTFYESELGQKTLQLTPTISRSISSKTRDITTMALDQAKEELAIELKESLKK